MPIKSKKKYEKNDPKNPVKYSRAQMLVGEDSVRVDLKTEEGELIPDASYRIDLTDMPVQPMMPKKDTLVPDCMVFMNVKEKKVFSVNPWEGEFDAIAFDLGPKSEDGSIPVFEVVHYKEEDRDDKKFWCAYEIVGDPSFGLFVGSKPRYHLKYRFAESDEGTVEWDGNAENPKSTRIRQLAKWTQVHGIDGDMEWPASGNVLPIMLERLKANSAPVRISIEGGWIVRVAKLYGQPVSVVPDEKPGLTDETFGESK